MYLLIEKINQDITHNQGIKLLKNIISNINFMSQGRI